MLFDVTAVLSASVALGIAPGVIVVPKTGPSLTAVVQVEPAAVPVAGSGAAPDAELSRLAGLPLLEHLSMSTPLEVEQTVAANPASIDALLAAPPATDSVRAWWQSLDEPQRTRLAETVPQLVGNLEGVPMHARDDANRAFLADSIDDVAVQLDSGIGRAAAASLEQRVRMLEAVEETLQASETDAPLGLLSLDPEGAGKAAIVVGDLATAEYVSYLIPGMFFTVEGQMKDWTAEAIQLRDEQRSWLDRLGRADEEVAVVAWLGYQTPSLVDIGGLELAEEGRDLLARSLDGLLVQREGNEPYLSLVAHSYGSTAALMMLTEFDIEVDSLVLVGSPGSAAGSVEQLHVRGGEVYVGEAAWDFVPDSAFFGSDPGSPEYGAHVLDVDGGADPITGKKLAPAFGHNGYFDADTEAMRNMALVSIGEGDLATIVDEAAPARVVAER